MNCKYCSRPIRWWQFRFVHDKALVHTVCRKVWMDGYCLGHEDCRRERTVAEEKWKRNLTEELLLIPKEKTG